MASLFQKSITRYLLNGRQVPSTTPGARKVTMKSETWSGKFNGADGKEVVESLGTKDRGEALQILAQRVKNAQREALGDYDPTEEHRMRPLMEHLDDYFAASAAVGNTEKHVQHARSRINKIVDYCGFKRLHDINTAKVQQFIATLKARNKAMATQNHYVVAIHGFVNWLVKAERLTRSPLRQLKKQNAATDIRHRRRALSLDEVSRLIRAAENSGATWRHLDPRSRAALYHFASRTGIRAQECASLTRASFDLSGDTPTVTIEAKYSKNRTECTLPLCSDLVARLRPWLANGGGAEEEQSAVLSIARAAAKRTERLWPGPWWKHGAEIVRRDLQSAGIEYKTDEGYADFHSLRHSFVSALANAGVHPKQAQLLARHSTMEMTMKVYTHLRLNDLAAAVGALPAIQQNAASSATGT